MVTACQTDVTSDTRKSSVPVRQNRQKTSASEEAGYSNRYWKCSVDATGRAREVAEKITYSVILSEAKNLSLFVPLSVNRREILRFAQNDSVLSFSAACRGNY